MIYTVELFNSKATNYSTTPQWWRNFIRGNTPGNRFNREETNDRLWEYSASYVVLNRDMGDVQRYVDFYDEKAYTWFILRWS